MSYSRPGCLIDSVNGRRAGGYRRHPGVSNQPEPADYPTTADYESALANWDDDPGRETVTSPWYVFACWPSDGLEFKDFTFTPRQLERIRSQKAWFEIPNYQEAEPPVRAQLRMIVDEFLFECAEHEERQGLNLTIL